MIGRAGRVVAVCSALRGENTLHSRDRYLLDAPSLLAADDMASATGGAIVGFYHSHPDSLPIPSATDRQMAWTGYVYIIVGATGSRTRVASAWTIEEGRRIRPALLIPSQD